MIGMKTHFIRIGGCDYRCSWCDSMYAVDPDQVALLPQMTSQEILDRVLDLPESEWVTISGGNPALFNLDYLVHLLHYAGYKVAIETQGTVFKDWLIACEVVTCSPKPPSAGNITQDYSVHRFIQQFENHPGRARVVLKIVVFDDTDYEYAHSIFTMFPGYEKWLQVGNPDVAREPEEGDVLHRIDLLVRLRWLCDKLIADEDPVMQQVRVTPQLHTLIWGNARAV